MLFELEKTTKNYDLYKQIEGGINRLYLPKQPNPPQRVMVTVEAVSE